MLVIWDTDSWYCIYVDGSETDYVYYVYVIFRFDWLYGFSQVSHGFCQI